MISLFLLCFIPLLIASPNSDARLDASIDEFLSRLEFQVKKELKSTALTKIQYKTLTDKDPQNEFQDALVQDLGSQLVASFEPQTRASFSQLQQSASQVDNDSDKKDLSLQAYKNLESKWREHSSETIQSWLSIHVKEVDRDHPRSSQSAISQHSHSIEKRGLIMFLGEMLLFVGGVAVSIAGLFALILLAPLVAFAALLGFIIMLPFALL